jgi:hypothetical protein
VAEQRRALFVDPPAADDEPARVQQPHGGAAGSARHGDLLDTALYRERRRTAGGRRIIDPRGERERERDREEGNHEPSRHRPKVPGTVVARSSP